VVEFFDTVRVSGSDHAVMSSGLATSSVVFSGKRVTKDPARLAVRGRTVL